MSKQSTLQADVTDTARQLADEGKEFAQNMREKVTPLMSTAKERASVLGQQIKERARDNAQVVDRYVHDNPWSFIGLGLATGFLASWYLLRRDR